MTTSFPHEKKILHVHSHTHMPRNRYTHASLLHTWGLCTCCSHCTTHPSPYTAWKTPTHSSKPHSSPPLGRLPLPTSSPWLPLWPSLCLKQTLRIVLLSTVQGLLVYGWGAACSGCISSFSRFLALGILSVCWLTERASKCTHTKNLQEEMTEEILGRVEMMNCWEYAVWPRLSPSPFLVPSVPPLAEMTP